VLDDVNIESEKWISWSLTLIFI